MGPAEKLSSAAQPIDDLLGAAESILLSVVGRIASWGASIPNTVLVARSAMDVFQLSWGLSLSIAVSLELIGHALVSHWQDARAWNATRRKTDLGVNAALAMGLVVGYFILDITMVGVLALSVYLTSGDWRIGIALCYPLFGIAVAVVTNERAHLFRLKQAVKADRAQKRADRKRTPVPPTVPTVPPGGPRERAKVLLAERPTIQGSELGRELGVSESYGRRLKHSVTPSNGGVPSGTP